MKKCRNMRVQSATQNLNIVELTNTIITKRQFVRKFNFMKINKELTSGNVQ